MPCPSRGGNRTAVVEYTPGIFRHVEPLSVRTVRANQAKLNYPFGVTSNPRYNNGVTAVGRQMWASAAAVPMSFEPADEYKGDFARACFLYGDGL